MLTRLAPMRLCADPRHRDRLHVRGLEKEKADKREVQRQWADAGGDGAASAGGAAAAEGADGKRIKLEADDGLAPIEMNMRALTDSVVTTIGTTDPVGDFHKMLARRDVDFVRPGEPTKSFSIARLSYAHADERDHGKTTSEAGDGRAVVDPSHGPTECRRH